MTHDEAMSMPLGRELWNYIYAARGRVGKWSSSFAPMQHEWSALAVDLWSELPKGYEAWRSIHEVTIWQGHGKEGFTIVNGTGPEAFCLCVVRAWLNCKRPETESGK